MPQMTHLDEHGREVFVTGDKVAMGHYCRQHGLTPPWETPVMNVAEPIQVLKSGAPRYFPQMVSNILKSKQEPLPTPVWNWGNDEQAQPQQQVIQQRPSASGQLPLPAPTWKW